jgi:hypothetical protein
VRVLFDQGTPAPLRGAMTAHVVSTAYEMGSSALSNGDLLDAAEAQFDSFLTLLQELLDREDAELATRHAQECFFAANRVR